MNEYTFDELNVGMSECFTVKITPEIEQTFRLMTGDENPLHRDDAYAQEISGGKYPAHVTYGMLTASFLSTLAGVYLPGKYSLIHSIDGLSFKKPVFAGDELTITGTVKSKEEGLRLIVVDVKVVNQDGKTVLKAEMKNIVQK